MVKAKIQSILENRARQKHVRACEAQLAEALDVFANSLRAGLTFVQAMAYLAEELPAPLGKEFQHVVQEHRLGLPLEDSFERLRQRVPSELVRLALAGVLITRQSGGDLAQILKNLSETLRERHRLVEQIRILTSQGRMSGWILGLLPFGLAFALAVMDPELMWPLVTTWKGRLLLLAALTLEGVGAFTIRRIVTIEF